MYKSMGPRMPGKVGKSLHMCDSCCCYDYSTTTTTVVLLLLPLLLGRCRDGRFLFLCVLLHYSYVAETIISALKELPQRPTFLLTDGAAVMVAAYVIIEAALPGILCGVCTTHTLNLFLKEVGNIASIGDVIAVGKKVNLWLHEHHLPRGLLRKYTLEQLGRELAPVVPAETRFGLYFIMLHRLLRLEPALVAMVHDKKIKEDTKAATKEAVGVIMDKAFWSDAKKLVELLWPAMDFLRLTDSEKPYMGLVVDGWRRVANSLAVAKDKEGWALGERIGALELEEMVNLLSNQIRWPRQGAQHNLAQVHISTTPMPMPICATPSSGTRAP